MILISRFYMYTRQPRPDSRSIYISLNQYGQVQSRQKTYVSLPKDSGESTPGTHSWIKRITLTIK